MNRADRKNLGLVLANLWIGAVSVLFVRTVWHLSTEDSERALHLVIAVFVTVVILAANFSLWRLWWKNLD